MLAHVKPTLPGAASHGNHSVETVGFAGAARAREAVTW